MLAKMSAKFIPSGLGFVLQKEPQQVVVLLEHTTKPRPKDFPSEGIFQGWSFKGQQVRVDKTTLANFRHANRKTVMLHFEPTVAHKYIGSDELNAVFRDKDGWKQFHERYPGAHGFYSFARVGFGRGRTEAIMYVEEYAGLLEAGGRYVLFRKFDGHWGYVAEKMIWIS